MPDSARGAERSVESASKRRRKRLMLLFGILFCAGVTALTSTSSQANFSSDSNNDNNLYQADDLDSHLVTSLAASRSATTECTLTWVQPTGVPSGATYILTDDQGTQLATGLTGTTTTIDVGVPELVTLRVFTSVSPWISTAYTSVNCAGIPTAPRNLVPLAGDSSSDISWDAPDSDGGDTITGYMVTAVPDTSGLNSGITTQSCTTTGALACSLPNLVNGVTYTVSVTATNSFGTSASSASETVIPYPATIMNSTDLRLWLDAADTDTLLSSSDCTGAAVSDAGSAIGCWLDKSSNANRVTQATPANAPQLTQLGINTSIRFSGAQWLHADNPTGLPAAQTDFAWFTANTRYSTATQVRLAWGTLADGGLMQSYSTSIYKAGPYGVGSASSSSVNASTPFIGSGQARSGAQVTARAHGGADTIAYTVYDLGTEILTLGRQGTNDKYLLNGQLPEIILLGAIPSVTDRRVVDEYLARKWQAPLTPRQPLAVSGVAGDGEITASWAAPTWDGGSIITGYTLTATPDTTDAINAGLTAKTCTTAGALTCTVTGLTNGAKYTLTATATNDLGVGVSSTATGTSWAIPYPAAIMNSADLRAWLDAADPSTLLSASDCTGAAVTGAGSNVGCWLDKSGYDNHVFQTTSANQPLVGILNDLSSIDFDDTFRYLGRTALNSLPTNKQDSLLLTAARVDEVNDGSFIAVFGRGAYGALITQNIYQGNNRTSIYGVGTSTGRTTVAGETNIFGSRANSGDTIQSFADGGAYPVQSAVHNLGNSVFNVGYSPVKTTSFFDGSIGEILVMSGSVSTAGQRALDEYLGRKWSSPLVPREPQSVVATPGPLEITASWAVPTWNGGSAITGYTVTATPDTSNAINSDATAQTCSTTTALTCTVTGLTAGVTYTVTVSANNAEGASISDAGIVEVIPYPVELDSADLDLWLDGADTSTMFTDSTCTGANAAATDVIKCWQDKSSNANHVTQADATKAPTNGVLADHSAPQFSGTQWLQRTNPEGLPAGANDGTFFTVSNVSDVTNHEVHMSWGSESTGQMMMAMSDAEMFRASVLNVNWANGHPISDNTTVIGGADFMGGSSYVAFNQAQPDGATSYAGYSLGASELNVGRMSTNSADPLAGTVPEVLVFTGLRTLTERENIEEYLARKWNSPLAPRAPLNAVATAGEGQIDVSWGTPSWDGGSAITGYTATATPDTSTAATAGLTPQSCTTTGTTCTITGLVDGGQYTVTVSATNAIGTGRPSAEILAIPYPATLLSDANLSLWLDGADASTLLTDSTCTGAVAGSGGSIGCWIDKSGQGNHVTQATSANAPTHGTLNRLSAPQLSGSQWFFRANPTSLPASTGDGSVVGVANIADPMANNSVLFWGNPSSRNALMMGTSAGKAANALFQINWAQSEPVIANTSFVLHGDVIGGTSYTASAHGMEAHVTTTTYNLSTNELAIGRTGSLAQDYVTGFTPEYFMFNRLLSSTERRTLELYLARKWGTDLAPVAAQNVVASIAEAESVVSWDAPAETDGPTVTGYTVTATPDTALPINSDLTPQTCTTTTTTCTVLGLVNGVTYSMSVVAHSDDADSPVASAGSTVLPYPISIMNATDMKLWLDGADSSSMFIDSTCSGTSVATGDAIGCWSDKSAAGNDVVQATSAKQPTAVSFAGHATAPQFVPSQFLARASGVNLPLGTATSSSFGVLHRYAADDNQAGAWFYGTNTTNNARQVFVSTDKLFANTWHGASPTAGVVSKGVSYVYSSTHTASATTVRLNSGISTTSANVPNTLAGSLVIGTKMDDTNGMLPEFIMLSTDPSAEQRRMIDSYLARKWGAAISPDAPTNVSGVPGDGQIVATWDAPAWNGGSGVAGYTVTAIPNTSTAMTAGLTAKNCSTSGATTCTVTGLTNGGSYTLKVTATNARGTSFEGTANQPLVPYPTPVMTSSNVKLWLDGADATTLFVDSSCTGATATSGGTVGCWRDKSSSSNHGIQAAADARATVTTEGANTSLLFDGSNDAFPVANSLLPNGSATSSTFAAFRNVDTAPASSGYRGLYMWGTPYLNVGRNFYKGTGSAELLTHTWNSATLLVGTISTTKSQLSYVENTVTGLATALDGATKNSTTNNAMNTSSTGSGYIGSLSSASFWKGKISEVVILDDAVTEDERRSVDKYLAMKWNNPVAPDAPTSVSATAGDTTITASWSAPTWNGGSAVIGYRAIATPDTSHEVNTGLTSKSCTTTGNSCTISGLENGVTYTVQAQAENTLGWSGYSGTSADATPYPATLMTASNLKLWLDGADAATLYTDDACTISATATGDAVGCWQDKSGQSNHATQAVAADAPTLTTLGGNTALSFDGTSQNLTFDSTLVPSGTDPSTSFMAFKMTDPTPDTSEYRGLLQWGPDPTITEQGRLITKDLWSRDLLAWSWGGTAAPGPITPNRNSVAWVNERADAIEASIYSQPSNTGSQSLNSSSSAPGYVGKVFSGSHWMGPISEVIVLGSSPTAAEKRTLDEYLARKWEAPITPDAPTGIAATPGDSQASVSWTAPAWNGGTAITGYTVTASGGAGTCTTTGALTCTVTGLIPGQSYAFTVTATNTRGTGVASPVSASVTVN